MARIPADEQELPGFGGTAVEELGPTGRPLRPSAEAEARYTREVDEAAASTVWLTGGCRSWYLDETSGRLALLWPDTVEAFRERGAAFDAADFEAATAGRPGSPVR